MSRNHSNPLSYTIRLTSLLALTVAVLWSSAAQAQARPAFEWVQTSLQEPTGKLFTPASGALLVRTSDGLARSDDAGATWHADTSPPGFSYHVKLTIPPPGTDLVAALGGAVHLGLSCYPSDGRTPEEIVARAAPDADAERPSLARATQRPVANGALERMRPWSSVSPRERFPSSSPASRDRANRCARAFCSSPIRHGSP